MTLRQYLENKGFDTVSAILISSDFKGHTNFHTTAMKAFYLGKVEGVLMQEYRANRQTRNAFFRLVHNKAYNLI